ncbi:MAG: site-2 protease family protein [Acutalibacteraceae bacterium]
MRFKLFGTEFYVSFLFAAVITAMLAFDRTGYVLPLFFAVLIHEAGHLCAMWILDCAPKRVRLVPAAVEITTKIGSSGKNEILIALCGPAVNLLMFGTLFLNYLAFGNDSYLSTGLINLLIGVFNLMPVTGLDGGTVVFNLLCRKTEPQRAGLIMRIINLSVAAAAVITAVTLCFKGQFNLSFFILALYLIVMSIIKI